MINEIYYCSNIKAAPRRQSKEEIADSEAIEQFVRLHTQVINLTKTYAQLIANGCTFFETYWFGIYCERPDEVLIGQISSDSSLSKIIRQDSNLPLNLGQIQEFFSSALSEWAKLVESLRDQFRNLNYFDLNQIKYLIIHLNK